MNKIQTEFPQSGSFPRNGMPRAFAVKKVVVSFRLFVVEKLRLR